jgi:hypothetical protein
MLQNKVYILIGDTTAVSLPLGMQVQDKASHGALRGRSYRNAGMTSLPHRSIAFGASGPMKLVQKMS